MKKNILVFVATGLFMFTVAMAQQNPVAGVNGNKYVPYEERTGNYIWFHNLKVIKQNKQYF